MSHDRFFKMLENVPRIAPIWDQKNRSMNCDLYAHELGVMSSGEVQMAKFFASLWNNNNNVAEAEFDLIYAVAFISSSERALIMGWIADPFWP